MLTHTPRRALPGGSRLDAGPFWAWLLLCGLLTVGMGYLRLVAFPGRMVPLAYGLVLLVCLLNRDLRLLYGMALAFSAIALFKIFLFLPRHAGAAGIELWDEWAAALMQLANIWVVAGTIHGLLSFQRRIEEKNAQLEMTNAELEASNEELAAREEEIIRQNEELQAQAQELEQQTEELRQQTEEAEAAATELNATNEELARREKGLRTLLESAQWLRSDAGEQEVMAAVCQAALELMEDSAVAAVIVQEKDGKLWLRGHRGFGVHGTIKREIDFSRSFAALVVESGRTAYLKDVHTRPDLEFLQPLVGPPFRSVLASPIWSEGRPFASLQIYAREPREWTEEEFRVVEWLAAQAALALRAVEYQEELEIKRREAEEASIQKTRFLAAVSHDVRTPANAISLMADLIEQAAGDAELARELPQMARDLKSNARSLVELVSDVLDLARFDTGRLDLQVSDFPLGPFIEAELRQFRRLTTAKGIRLVTCLPPEPVWLRTDKLKLGRVLSNLVGNAVKFTDAGEVQVGAELRADGMLELIVADTGPGIAPEHLPRIFDEFFQLRNPERDRNRGTGLGLAICRRLVDALGCSISVESTPGRGSTFFIRLPSELVVARPPVSASPEAGHYQSDGEASSLLGGLRILLVEDHETTRTAVAQLLEGHGALVLQAATARAAIHMLAHENPDVLLLDLMLPDQDGTEVLRHVRHHGPGSLRCILAVSGDVRDERVEEVKRLGAHDLVPKPLNLATLICALRRHLSPPEAPAAPPHSADPMLNGSDHESQAKVISQKPVPKAC